jgi:hypothetical protein
MPSTQAGEANEIQPWKSEELPGDAIESLWHIFDTRIHVPESNQTNLISIPVNSDDASVFFRLVYP